MNKTAELVKITKFLSSSNCKIRGDVNINKEDFTVDADRTVIITNLPGDIPIQFGKVMDEFYCDHCNLSSLKGVPIYVGKRFICMHCNLKSLVGLPEYVGLEINVADNNLTSFEGCPKHMKTFCCAGNQFTSLIGAPEYVDGDFDCDNNQLTTLEGAPKYVKKDFDCRRNPHLKSLKGIGRVDGFIYSDFFVGKLEDYKGEL